MSLQSSVNKSILELAERVAAKLGYKSADEAEQALGTAFTKQVDKEAASSGTRALPTQADAALRGRPVAGIDAQPQMPPSTTPSVPMARTTAEPMETPSIENDLPDVDSLTGKVGKGAAALGLGVAGLYGASQYKGPLRPDAEGTEEPARTAEALPPPTVPAVESTKDAIGGSSTLPQDKESVNNIPAPKAPSDKPLMDQIRKFQDYSDKFQEDGADTSKIDAQIAEAREQYKNEKDRNQTLNLAQLIGTSLARMGAAMYGQARGRTILEDINIPTVDYDKRNEAARQDSRDLIGSLEDRRRESRAETSKKSERKYDRGVTSLKAGIGAEELKYKEGQDNYRKSLSDIVNAAKQTQSDNRADARTAAQEEKANRDVGKVLLAASSKEEAALVKQQQRLEAAAAGIYSNDKKIRNAAEQALAAAGISEEQIAQATEETTEAGSVGNLFNSKPVFDKEHPELASKNILQHLDLQSKIDELRAQKAVANKMLLSGTSADKAAAELLSGGEAPSPASGSPSYIVHKSGAKKPYNEQVWNNIQASPEAADFRTE